MLDDTEEVSDTLSDIIAVALLVLPLTITLLLLMKKFPDISTVLKWVVFDSTTTAVATTLVNGRADASYPALLVVDGWLLLSNKSPFANLPASSIGSALAKVPDTVEFDVMVRLALTNDSISIILGSPPILVALITPLATLLYLTPPSFTVTKSIAPDTALPDTFAWSTIGNFLAVLNLLYVANGTSYISFHWYLSAVVMYISSSGEVCDADGCSVDGAPLLFPRHLNTLKSPLASSTCAKNCLFFKSPSLWSYWAYTVPDVHALFAIMCFISLSVTCLPYIISLYGS